MYKISKILILWESRIQILCYDVIGGYSTAIDNLICDTFYINFNFKYQQAIM